MKTVKKEAKISFEERKSKFISYVKPINTRSEANEFIDNISTMNYDARHNVYAYKVIENGQEYMKFSDDGEPQNTAGKPAMEIINILGISNVVLVITRYFGGIKLGAGGLIRNYAKSAKLGIEAAEVIEYVEMFNIIIDFPYSKSSDIDYELKKLNVEIYDKEFEARVLYRMKADRVAIDRLEEIGDIILIKD